MTEQLMVVCAALAFWAVVGVILVVTGGKAR